MRTRIRTTAAAMMLIATLAGCSSTDSIATSESPSQVTSSITSPANVRTITCREYRQLDPGAQLAVLRELIAQPDFPRPTASPEGAKPWIDENCASPEKDSVTVRAPWACGSTLLSDN